MGFLQVLRLCANRRAKRGVFLGVTRYFRARFDQRSSSVPLDGRPCPPDGPDLSLAQVQPRQFQRRPSLVRYAGQAVQATGLLLGVLLSAVVSVAKSRTFWFRSRGQLSPDSGSGTEP
ncbi:MAG: hypothetical protein KJ624_00045 [Chloroflexi bacterium]|nr:hypothetical protein [Chloroflexota bacterium]